MRSPLARTLLVLAVFAIGLVGALLLLRTSSDGDAESASGSGSDGATSIWAVGDEWTVRVSQDAGAITPDGERSVADVPYRFRVASGNDADGWLVKVTQDGAEGPFAKGWKLTYRPDGDALALHRVAIGDEPALEAELAAIVLGPQFPYEVRYEKAPAADATVTAEKLLERSQLPPSTLPGGDDVDPGRRPPAEAPPLPGEVAPTPPGA